jgi:ABC-type sugar transport system ATPase subunit
MGLAENATILLLEKISNFFGISQDKENSLTKQMMETYEIKAASIDQEIKFLSGGNQQKVIIGRSMQTKPKVLVFDEPTKGIDVGTKTQIYKLMKKLAEEEGVGIILISSEMDEVLRCSNRIIAMYDGRIVSEFDSVDTEFDRKRVLNAIIGTT